MTLGVLVAFVVAIAAGIVITLAGAGTAIAAENSDTVTVAIVAGAYK